ncbi:MAG: hypothetical protein RMM31_07755 [Anaerolineae bacterium]|nr:hypothetical protein [Anaerolineae bacterium]
MHFHGMPINAPFTRTRIDFDLDQDGIEGELGHVSIGSGTSVFAAYNEDSKLKFTGYQVTPASGNVSFLYVFLCTAH